VIIGDYNDHPSSTYPAKVITNDAAATMEALGYTVYRTPGWNSGANGYNGTHYTYTNAVFINDMVLIPWFNGYASENAAALATFQAACPDKTIIQIDCSNIITYAGAIHCVVMHVPDPELIFSVFTPFEPLEAAGPVGGPFENDSKVFTVNNEGDAPMEYTVTATQPWVDITNGSGTVPAGQTADVTVSINALANDLPRDIYTDTITFTNLTSGSGNTQRQVILDVGAPTLQYQWTLDTDPGWTMEGGWGFGQPTGQGGENGSPDPTSGSTGANVLGYNLNGDYDPFISQEHMATTAIDCSDFERVTLKFKRWLGVDRPQNDRAYIRVSTNGLTWASVWANPGEITDSEWVPVEYDISNRADGKDTVYIRWTMGSVNGEDQYCGWNIDDVEIWAVNLNPALPCPWDANADSDVGVDDFFALLQNWGPCPVDCPWDYDDDNEVGVPDFFALLQNWGPCPE
jgi:hypothetical protein